MFNGVFLDRFKISNDHFSGSRIIINISNCSFQNPEDASCNKRIYDHNHMLSAKITTISIFQRRENFTQNTA